MPSPVNWESLEVAVQEFGRVIGEDIELVPLESAVAIQRPVAGPAQWIYVGSISRLRVWMEGFARGFQYAKGHEF